MKTNYSLKNVFASAIVVCGILFSHAEAQIVNGINYTIINGNSVEVAPLPKNGDQDVRYTQASIVIPASVEIAGTTYPVKRIGTNSMRENPNLTSVTISEGVEVIGNSAFASCKALTSVTVPASVNSIEDWSFYECSALTTINIPDGIKAIGEHMFQLSGLTSITLPASVTSLKTCAFQDAKNLVSINLENIKTIGQWVLYGTAIQSVDISKVGTIGDWSFQNCKQLKNIKMGTLESINQGAFSGCSALTSLVIPSSVIYVGNWALEKTGLTEVFISWANPAETVFIEEFAGGKDDGKAKFTWKVPAEYAAVYGSTWNGFPVATGTTGIKWIEAENATAYYSNGMLNLVNVSGYQATIHSVTGQKLMQFQVNDENSQVSVSLAKGVYILNATNANNRKVTKFIVK